jgi:hypothetical protein
MLGSRVQCRYGNELVKRTLIGNDFTATGLVPILPTSFFGGSWGHLVISTLEVVEVVGAQD